jgi:hypothetical protein
LPISAWFSFFGMKVSVFLAPALPASTSASVCAKHHHDAALVRVLILRQVQVYPVFLLVLWLLRPANFRPVHVNLALQGGLVPAHQQALPYGRTFSPLKSIETMVIMCG